MVGVCFVVDIQRSVVRFCERFISSCVQIQCDVQIINRFLVGFSCECQVMFAGHFT